MTESSHYEITVEKITGSSFTNDGKHACLKFTDNKGNAFDLNIPIDQAHTAAVAILVAAGAADVSAGAATMPVVPTSKIGIGRNAQSPNELFVQILFLADGGQLAFQFDRACADMLAASLQEFLDGEPSSPTVTH